MAQLLFFGKLADFAGGRQRDFPLTDAARSVGELIQALSSENPALGAALAELKVRFLVNEEMVGKDAAVNDSDEIAFLPPVSGG